MKRLIFLFLTAPIFLSAQQEPVKDTSYFVKQGFTFYDVRVLTYQDGSENTTKSPIGDTLALVRATQDRITSKAAALAVDARYISTARRQLTELARESDAVLALTGVEPLKKVVEELSSPFMLSGWTIRRDGATSDIVFTVNAQGNLRYAVNGGATKAAQLFGDVLRLKNYPSNGADTDLFRLRSGVLVNLTRETVLRPPGNDTPLNRSAAPPPAVKKKGN